MVAAEDGKTIDETKPPVETPAAEPAAPVTDESEAETEEGDLDPFGIAEDAVESPTEAESEEVVEKKPAEPVVEEKPAEPVVEEKPAEPVKPPLYDNLDAIDPEAVAEDPEVCTKISEEARKAVAEKLGEEFDEFNSKHIVMFNNVSRRLTTQVVNEVRFQKQSKIAEREMKKMLPNEAAHAYAVEKFQNMTFREAEKIRLAEQNGDFETVLKFFKKCREEFDGETTTKKKVDDKIAEIKRPSSKVSQPATDTVPDDEDDGLELFGMKQT